MDTEFISSMVQPGRDTQARPTQWFLPSCSVCEGQDPVVLLRGFLHSAPFREPRRNDRALSVASVSPLSSADSVILGGPAGWPSMVPVGEQSCFLPTDLNPRSSTALTPTLPPQRSEQ